MANQGLLALMHELHRILNREDVAAHVAIDPIDHGRQGGGFARARGPRDQHQALGPGAELAQHRRQAELVEAGDPVGDQSQHHGQAAEGIHQVDANPHEGEGMGAIELFFTPKAFRHAHAEHLLGPAAKGGPIRNRPTGADDVAAEAIAGLLANPEMDIGIVVLGRNPHNPFQVLRHGAADQAAGLVDGSAAWLPEAARAAGRRRQTGLDRPILLNCCAID